MKFEIERREIYVKGYEQVVEFKESSTGLHCIVAIHSTRLGPAVGGTRVQSYSSFEKALDDVLRLAEGMTYKSALVQAGFGGAKAVIIGDPETIKSEQLWSAYAEAINSFDGQFITGKDMGATVEDLAILHRYTHYVIGSTGCEHSGDPCPFTAYGVMRAVEAAARWIWSTESLKDKRVAIQGVGGVGGHLAAFLFWKGADLIVCDIEPRLAERARIKYGAQVVDHGEIYEVECDIFSPCAGGGVLNEQTIEQLRCAAVVGGANNQLASDHCAELLRERGILYAPDFVVNAGGLLNGVAELEPGGYDPRRVRHQLEEVAHTLFSIYRTSFERYASTQQVAVEEASKRIEEGVGRRDHELIFPA